MSLRIPDFDYLQVPVGDISLNVAVGGAGPPVVLLHGFPQTHLAWRHVAADLATDHQVICPDLRGYGDSGKPVAAPDLHTYTKRTMAEDVVRVAGYLGAERFCLAGHDRGALVAFRAALDHPQAVSGLVVIDAVPVIDMWESLTGTAGVFAWHQSFLAQHPLAEQMINADPDVFFGHFLDGWTMVPDAMPVEIRAAYLAAARTPESVHAVCADHRASAYVDVEHDSWDRDADTTLAMPVSALWQDPGVLPIPFDPAKVWGAWAPDLRTAALPGGRFLPEKRPAEVASAVRSLVRDTAPPLAG